MMPPVRPAPTRIQKNGEQKALCASKRIRGIFDRGKTVGSTTSVCWTSDILFVNHEEESGGGDSPDYQPIGETQ